LKEYTESTINSQNKWENLLNIKEVNWEFVYIWSNDCTLDNTLKICHFSFSTTFPLIAMLGFNQMGWHLTWVASFTSSPSNIVDQLRKISLQNGLNSVDNICGGA
jgi:hypothetical protein